MREVRPWNRFPREAGAAPSLAVPEARLGGVWAAWAAGRGPCMAGGWDWRSFEVPSDPNQSDSMKYQSIF